LDSTSTLVFDAKDQVLGRLASHVASTLLVTRREGNPKKVIIINAENAIVTGSKDRVLADYDRKYKLNHPRKGPFFPRMPDMILKRTVRGMLPYQSSYDIAIAASAPSQTRLSTAGRTLRAMRRWLRRWQRSPWRRTPCRLRGAQRPPEPRR
jgi:hypothetical protein